MLAGQLTLTQHHVTPEPRRNRATQPNSAQPLTQAPGQERDIH
jgi:hypothetical protein